MRIGLLADTFSVEAGTGIARYANEVLRGLCVLGLDARPLSLPAREFRLGTLVNHVARMPYMVSRRAKDLDLVHAASPVCALGFPFVSKPKVVTYHDLVTLICKNTSVAFYARLLAPLSYRIGWLADRVIADSSQTKEQITTHLGIPEHRIRVVNLGVDSRFVPMKTETRRHYVIGYVGALSRRKRVDSLLRAFYLLKERHPKLPVRLAICGSRRLEYPALVDLVTELNVSRDVEFRGFVAEETLAQTYNSFDVFVLPSESEGFGLPILEAQRCGVPVIVRSGAQIPREVSKACLISGSEGEMADQIFGLLTDAASRSAVIQEGLVYSAQFTWEKTVQQTLEVYSEIV